MRLKNGFQGNSYPSLPLAMLQVLEAVMLRDPAFEAFAGQVGIG